MYRTYRRRCQGPHQPGHSPPAGAADGKRSPQDRTDERAAAVAARHADPLLRRRDRHGRQLLPGRPQRRPHADAVERRPQRRLLARESAEPVSAGQSSIPNTTTKCATSKCSMPIRIRCCGGRGGSSTCARSTHAFGNGNLRVARLEQCQSLRVPPRDDDETSSGRREPVAVLAARGARSLAIPRPHAGRDCSATRKFPTIGEEPYLLSLGPHGFYLVLHRTADDADRPRTVAIRTADLSHANRIGRNFSSRVDPQSVLRSDRSLPASSSLVCRQGAHCRRAV